MRQRWVLRLDCRRLLLLRELELVASGLAVCALQRSLWLRLRVEVHARGDELVVRGEALRVVGVVRGGCTSSAPAVAGRLQELVLAGMHRLAGVADVAILC